MAIDMSKVFAELGEDVAAQCGEPVGLDRNQSVRVAQALARNIGGGKDLAVKATAAETALTEEVVGAMLGKLVEAGKDKVLERSGDAIEGARTQAMAAIENVGGAATRGMLGKLGGLFGKKAG